MRNERASASSKPSRMPATITASARYTVVTNPLAIAGRVWRAISRLKKLNTKRSQAPIWLNG